MNKDINRRVKQYFELNKKDYFIDDISYNDLNLTDVFFKINKTLSSLGEEVLYYMLRRPLDNLDEINNLENNIRSYTDDENKRKNAIKALKKLDKLKNVSVFEYLNFIDNVEIKSIFSQLLPSIMMLICAGIIFFNATLGILALVLAFIVNTISYFKKYKEIKPYLICFAYLIKAINIGREIEDIEGDEYNKFAKMQVGSFLLGNLSGETSHGGSGSPFDLVLDLLKMGFHFDIIKFYSMTNTVKGNKEDIKKFLVHIGKIDAYLSIIEFRNSLETYCRPNFCANNSLKATNIYHPLLKNPVKNTINTNNSILLTGSNASGKSTFLRTIAVNAILAQTINTVMADAYEAPLYIITSSMDISDSINNGDSFYIAEIRSLKRIIDIKKDNMYILCTVDEVLKGTNTIERIAAAAYILKYLASKNMMVIAATHDIELCSILKNIYSNYHFEEDIHGSDIAFSYKLLEGQSKSTNALRLLEHMMFPDDIVFGARNMIDTYLKNGLWDIL